MPNARSWPICLTEKLNIVDMWAPVHGDTPVEKWQLDNLWCVHLYRYEAELTLNGERLHIRPGTAGIIPPGVTQEYRYRGRSEHCYAHFTMPESQTQPHRLASLQDLGTEFNPFYRAFERAIGAFRVRPLESEIMIWNLLWELAARTEAAEPVRPKIHSAVERALALIDMRLCQRLTVPAIARMVNLSGSHLNRLFHQDVGETVVGYIRRRRVERAYHLLRDSNVPIKVIAVESGMPDLQLFNKTIRRVLGVCPRDVRLGHVNGKDSLLSARPGDVWGLVASGDEAPPVAVGA